MGVSMAWIVGVLAARASHPPLGPWPAATPARSRARREPFEAQTHPPGVSRRAARPVRPGGSAVAPRRVRAEDVLHGAAHLAERSSVLQRLADRGQEVLAAASDAAQLLEAPFD